MCGIAGIVGASYNRAFPLDALSHRGPDDEGVWVDHNEGVWLGHRRLSILDLSEAGRQPMKCIGGRYQIVFNGEIYNFPELREVLTKKGYNFFTETDTEIIPAAYDCWGVDCLHRFNGMWAFGIWDNVKKNLWLARDRFGKKPLYYYAHNEELVFASEVRALHLWLGQSAQIDCDVVHSICEGKFEWHGTQRTYLAQVHTLPAGHFLVKSKDRLELRRWYRLEPNSVRVPASFGDQAERLRELLIDACRLRLRSDVPLATCLSGGLDSSSVTSVVHRRLPESGPRKAKDYHRAFLAAFPDTMLDESEGAKALAEAVGAKLVVHSIEPPSEKNLFSAISSCDGPMHSLAFYPIWVLYGFIRGNGVKVTLDGQGPDEMMGGYYETIRHALVAALRARRLRWAWDIYKTYGAQGEDKYRSSRAFARGELIDLFKGIFVPYKRAIVSWPRKGMHQSPPPLLQVQTTPPGLGALAAGLYSQFCQTLLPTILQQYDRCSMAHGIECRMPFMDYRLVEFIFSLPEESLVGGGFTKRVLRQAMRGLIPEATCFNRVKIGFNAPIVEWFQGPLRTIMLDTMQNTDFQQSTYFDGASLKMKFERWLQKPNWEEAWGFWPPVHFILWQAQMKGSLPAQA
jgi:asparagine synthase (glutamine-hydrolysing)